MMLLLNYMLLHGLAKKDVTITKATAKHNEKYPYTWFHFISQNISKWLRNDTRIRKTPTYGKTKQNKTSYSQQTKKHKAKQNSLDKSKYETCAMLSRK